MLRGTDLATKLMIEAIDHVQLTIPVEEEEAGKAFYIKLLGLPAIPKPVSLQNRGGFWLLVGQTPLHIGTEDGGKAEQNQSACRISS